jgi:hypothetical protein
MVNAKSGSFNRKPRDMVWAMARAQLEESRGGDEGGKEKSVEGEEVK